MDKQTFKSLVIASDGQRTVAMVDGELVGPVVSQIDFTARCGKTKLTLKCDKDTYISQGGAKMFREMAEALLNNGQGGNNATGGEVEVVDSSTIPCRNQKTLIYSIPSRVSSSLDGQISGTPSVNVEIKILPNVENKQQFFSALESLFDQIHKECDQLI